MSDRPDQPGATTIIYRGGVQHTYYFDARDLERLLRAWYATQQGDHQHETLCSYSVVFDDQHRAGQLVVDVTQIAVVQTIDVAETKRRLNRAAPTADQAPPSQD